MKVCKKCNEQKELDQFPICRTMADNHHSHCKKCLNEITKKRRDRIRNNEKEFGIV